MTASTDRPTSRSRWADLDGPVHYVDHGGPAGAPWVVLVHGLGGSHANWAAVAPYLTERYRVLALDLAGFGLTVGSPRSTSVSGNQELLHRFLTEVVGAPAIVVGNSMGGMITALQVSAHPETVLAAALLDPVLPLTPAPPDRMVMGIFAGFALPGPIRDRLEARREPVTTDRATAGLLRLCTDDPSRVPAPVVQEHVELAHRRYGVPNEEADFLLAARSLLLTFVRRRRYAKLLHALPVPVLLIHGDRDRLVPIRVARVTAAANPHWRFRVATGVGHVPMLEAPEWTAARLLEWIPAAVAQDH